MCCRCPRIMCDSTTGNDEGSAPRMYKMLGVYFLFLFSLGLERWCDLKFL